MTKDEIIEEQRNTIKVLNMCIGGESSTTTENLTRISRLEAEIESLKQPAQEPSYIYDLGAISWALDKLAKFGVTTNNADNALMADRLQMMLRQAPEAAIQSEASITKELQFLYDDLTEEYIAELDDKTVLIISGGNRARWFNKIRGIWYE